jgi:hypothetical protein
LSGHGRHVHENADDCENRCPGHCADFFVLAFALVLDDVVTGGVDVDVLWGSSSLSEIMPRASYSARWDSIVELAVGFNA